MKTLTIVIGIIIAVAVIGALGLVISGQPAQQDPQSPGPAATATPESQPELQEYTGRLKSGSSFFRDGNAVVEIVFEDGRTFIAEEQLAAQANMTIGKIYKVSFSSAAPETAISIQEK